MGVTLDIRQNNYQNIYNLFFSHTSLSKPQIVQLLNLSQPTVINNINQLEKEGKIKECGFVESNGGRPATLYTLEENSSFAVSVEIKQKQVRCAVINLLGGIVFQENYSLVFVNNQQYIEYLCRIIDSFIKNHKLNNEKILGIGISVQGIAHKSGKFMLYSKAAYSEFLATDYIQPYFVPEVKLFHDVKSAALAELWNVKKIDNAIYISISEHLGGAIFINNEIDLGKNGYSGALEHLIMDKNGSQCYCGKKGCLETYCSLTSLLGKNEPLEQFFKELRTNKQEHFKRWTEFLRNLAQGLNMVYLLLERDFILGGDIAEFLNEDDIAFLKYEIRQNATFSIEDIGISIGKQRNSTLIGAGLPFIREYLKKNCGFYL